MLQLVFSTGYSLRPALGRYIQLTMQLNRIFHCILTYLLTTFMWTILVYRLPIDFVAFPLVVFLLAGSRVLHPGELLMPSS